MNAKENANDAVLRALQLQFHETRGTLVRLVIWHDVAEAAIDAMRKLPSEVLTEALDLDHVNAT